MKLMSTRSLILTTALCSGLLMSCQSSNESQSSSPADSGAQAEAGAGTLQVAANGEDFVRQGFTSKDGWEISFDHVYVNLEDVTAYQTDPPFDPDAEDPLQAKSEVTIPAQMVDLAEGDESASPITVGETEAPAGQYNALAWKMAKATDGPAAGQTLVLAGQASKDGKTVDFTLNVDREFAYTCGEFVGDERKGVVEPSGAADLEATFHFDHVFGDGELPADDEMNVKALGFAPLAALADGSSLKADWATLEQKLDSKDFQALDAALAGLGHVGEGHCRSEQTTA
ncbi:hypothetical protein C1752_01125 [Acaryochloris thomasi RCC1774]|uniref:DUF4382 domain-containing protein n=1 Tax=Acaryochloris thomasi RCC1774 TaxID=1764569 RepID=A0A2W1JLL5_9CYAN|nr:DUF4382 domain-containing protein [Acaryochloris thomasi]PZD74253.1 hypothetical protein C1752_01125 [Acaryochloris thomasi RCC1774]